MTPDEARSVEDLPKLGGKYGELRENQNVTGKPVAPDDGETQAPPPSPRLAKTPNPNAKANAIVVESSARLLRKEIAQVKKLAVRHADNGDAFAAAVTEFYTAHAELVEQTLQMSAADVLSYCTTQAAQIINGNWIDALALWDTDAYASGLAEVALEEKAA